MNNFLIPLFVFVFTDGVYCNMTFDGFSCWGYAPANSTAKLLCPEFIMAYSSQRGTEITGKCESDE